MEDDEISWGKPSISEIREYFATPCPNVDPRSVMSFPSSDSSVDLDESFQLLLEKRRKKYEKNAVEKQTLVSSKKSDNTVRYFPKTPLVGKLDDTEDGSLLLGDQSELIELEDTFMRAEAMCEQTFDMSDQDSQVLTRANYPKPNFEDVTQLNDIEAPSMIWNQSIVHMNSPKASPIKMVHHLRPSTIIEESTIASSTINGSDRQSIASDSLNKVNEGKENIEADSLNESNNDTNEKENETSTMIMNESLPCSSEPSIVLIDSDSGEESGDEDEKNDDKELVDETKLESSNLKTINSTTYESFVTAKYNSSETSYYSAESTLRPKNVTSDTDVFPKKKHTFFRDSFANSSKSSSTSRGTASVDNSLDKEETETSTKIPDFNDTLEEMDFMMNQGMKFVGQQQKSTTSSSKTKTVVPKQRNSPATPRPKVFSPLRTANMNSKVSLFANNSKQATPNTFKKPQINTRLPTTKTKKFQHVQSPIQQYIKNAPQFPLQSKLHGPTGLINELGNRNTRETQYFGNENETKNSPKPQYESAVPCKAAIAASKTRLIDERTPVKFPGGEKVNKLIGKSTPVVIKHEGRFKSTDVYREINVDDTVDESLQNLSIASGDISFQVLKNLKRF